jgi:vesicle coat complex subunit
MKLMTCKQLGGACDQEFRAETFEEMSMEVQKHGMEMFQKNDAAHLDAMKKIQELMQNPEEMQKWMQERKKEFDSLTELK